MPTYEYRCNDCLKAFTVEAKMSDPAPTAGPGCAFQGCAIEKKMSRVMGWVKGKPSYRSEKAQPKPELTYEPQGVESSFEANDPVHLCSKYCDHHAKP